MPAISSLNTTIRDEILVSETLHAMDKRMVLMPWLNSVYEGELKNKGDTVAVQVIPNITFSTGTTAGGTITPSAVTITKETLVIDTLKQTGITVADYERAIVNFNLIVQFGGRFAKAAITTIESSAFTVLKSGIATGNKLQEGTPVTLTAANIYSYVESMRVVMEANDVDVDGGRAALFVSPAVASLIRQSPIFDSTDKGLSMRLNGFVGMFAGFEVFKTTNIGSNHMVGTVQDAVNFVVQWNKYKVVELTNAFSSNILAELCYGGKVFSVNNTSAVTLKYA